MIAQGSIYSVQYF